MKRLRPPRWAFQLQTCSTRHQTPFLFQCTRHNSTISEPISEVSKPSWLVPNSGPISSIVVDGIKPLPINVAREQMEQYPSPLPQQALLSPKLAALHARLNLPASFSIHTLARCLVDVTADENPQFNNASLSIIGGDFTGYLVSEHIICHYPRLPVEVVFAAQKAFAGPQSMANLTQEWGVDPVHAPGGEVDPGLLQFRRQLNTQPTYEVGFFERKRDAQNELLDPDNRDARRPGRIGRERTSQIERIMRLDQFGEDITALKSMVDQEGKSITTLEEASRSFVNAVVGGMLLHTGRSIAKTFVNQHILSRKLEISNLFSYVYPFKDLDLLCRREGLEPPIARLMAESGRKSSHPLYVVGIFSGRDKLGEGVGGSMKEAKTRAAIASLKAWYLYSPLQVTVPSTTESKSDITKWIPNLVDQGEVYR